MAAQLPQLPAINDYSHFSLTAKCPCANERTLYNPLRFDITTNKMFFFVIVWNEPSLMILRIVYCVFFVCGNSVKYSVV